MSTNIIIIVVANNGIITRHGGRGCNVVVHGKVELAGGSGSAAGYAGVVVVRHSITIIVLGCKYF